MPYGIYMSSKYQTDNLNYLRVTLAPSASSFFWISSASSLEAPSLTTLGAPSTTSLASFNPNPVNSLTTLITLILLAPALANTTSNSVFSSAVWQLSFCFSGFVKSTLQNLLFSFSNQFKLF